MTDAPLETYYLSLYNPSGKWQLDIQVEMTELAVETLKKSTHNTIRLLWFNNWLSQITKSS